MPGLEPTDEDKEDVLLAARYGDLDDIRQFVAHFGSQVLSDIRDENDNSVVHMACGNGHLDILEYLLPLVPPLLLASQNSAKSTPLHWAAINSHLAIVQKLVEYPDGPGADLIDIKNTAGRTPLGEAEFVGWDEGSAWLVKMMKLEGSDVVQETSDEVELEDESSVPAPDIEVEIQDADGQVARMTLPT